MDIHVIVNESGDWYVLYSGGSIFYEGHSLPYWVWVEALANVGIEVSVEEITDERMENGAF